MLSFLESSLIVVLSVAASLLLLFTLRRCWSPTSRREHNDLIGWQIGFLGTTYAVIIAFMLSGVWSNYQSAETNAEVEANSLLSVYRLARGLPDNDRESIQALARRYAVVMITEEWPAMNKGSTSTSSDVVFRSMWTQVMRAQPETPAQQATFGYLLRDLTSMAEHRRIRQLQSRSKLPAIFWVLLISGGSVVIAFTCLFGVENRWVHVIQVIAASYLISFALVTIADVDQPYRGGVHIDPDGFQLALHTIDETISHPAG